MPPGSLTRAVPLFVPRDICRFSDYKLPCLVRALECELLNATNFPPDTRIFALVRRCATPYEPQLTIGTICFEGIVLLRHHNSLHVRSLRGVVNWAHFTTALTTDLSDTPEELGA